MNKHELIIQIGNFFKGGARGWLAIVALVVIVGIISL